MQLSTNRRGCRWWCKQYLASTTRMFAAYASRRLNRISTGTCWVGVVYALRTPAAPCKTRHAEPGLQVSRLMWSRAVVLPDPGIEESSNSRGVVYNSSARWVLTIQSTNNPRSSGSMTTRNRLNHCYLCR
jgi:hypothetical protein